MENKLNYTMKNILILSIFLLISLQSCHSQSFDLSDLQFPVAKSSLVKYNLEDQDVLAMKYRMFKSSNPDLLYFKKEKLSGSRDNSFLSTNSVTFYNDDATNNIYAYRIKTFTVAENKKLLNVLTTTFGKPYYDYGKEDRFMIWESTNKKVIYLLEYRLDPGKESADLKVLDVAAADLLNQQLGGGFIYYKDYLLARAKKIGVYTYTDFLKDKKAQNRLYYLEESNTIK
jgi:hypothetical protein